MMISVSVYCQDSIQIKTKTFDNIIKEIDKCDSLKVAYKNKSNQLDTLINTNLSIFKELDVERARRLDYEKRLEEANNKIIKTSKKQDKSLLYGAGGVALGVLAVVLFGN